MPDDQRTIIPDLSELGKTGIVSVSGQIEDDILPEWRGSRKTRTIKQMISNDATVGGLLFALRMLIGQADFRIDSASDDNADKECAQFVDECLFHDMSTSWRDTVSDIVTFLPWGWEFSEIVYKLRDGDSTDPTRRSKYTDGRVGWRKWPIRRQDTLWAWVFDEEGGVKAMEQSAAPAYEVVTIPLEKALLFRTELNGGSPEGKSILRNAYRPWRMKTRIENLEGIGIERDLAGLPVAYLPSEYMSSNSSDTQKQVYEMVKKIVTSIRRDEQEGLVMPMSYDQNGKQQFDLKLLTTGGSRQFDIDSTINRYDHRILMSVLADFLMLGSGKVGSFALSSDKTDLFSLAVSATLDTICDVINAHGIPRLVKMNAFKVEQMPRLSHGDVETPNLTELADYISKGITAGALTPDPTLERYYRQAANLPQLPEETVA